MTTRRRVTSGHERSSCSRAMDEVESPSPFESRCDSVRSSRSALSPLPGGEPRRSLRRERRDDGVGTPSIRTRAASLVRESAAPRRLGNRNATGQRPAGARRGRSTRPSGGHHGSHFRHSGGSGFERHAHGLTPWRAFHDWPLPDNSLHFNATERTLMSDQPVAAALRMARRATTIGCSPFAVRI